MEIIELPFRFIPGGEDLPDLSAYRDPIILRARFEFAPPLTAPAPRQAEPEPHHA